MESLNGKYFVLGDPRHLHDQTYRRPASSIGRRKGSPVRAICCALVLLLFAFPAAADILDFEGLPSTYMFLGGGQNVGSYYSGVTLGPNVTGLDLTGSTAYPPHSGSIVLWDPFDLTVTISFNKPQSSVGLWYTSFDLLTLAAYDSSTALLSSVVAPANTDGTTGSSDFASLTAPDIAAITLTGSPGNYVFDDLTFSPQTASPVPEPESVILLLTALTLCRMSLRRAPLRGPSISRRREVV